MSDTFTPEDELKIIKILIGDTEVYSDDKFYGKLFDYYQAEMPYGTQKARDGDPAEWIYERLADEFAYLIEVTELTKKDIDNG